MIYLFTGRKQAGKNTAAEYLVANHGYKELSFAADIKQIIIDLDPIVKVYQSKVVHLSELLAEGHTIDELKETELEFRRLLQFLGTEVMRKRDPDFWVKQVVAQINDDPESNFVITDGRFHNEVSTLKSMGAVVIHVRNAKAEAVPAKHESELYAGSLGEDFEVFNESSIEALHEQIAFIHENNKELQS